MNFGSLQACRTSSRWTGGVWKREESRLNLHFQLQQLKDGCVMTKLGEDWWQLGLHSMEGWEEGQEPWCSSSSLIWFQNQIIHYLMLYLYQAMHPSASRLRRLSPGGSCQSLHKCKEPAFKGGACVPPVEHPLGCPPVKPPTFRLCWQQSPMMFGLILISA